VSILVERKINLRLKCYLPPSLGGNSHQHNRELKMYRQSQKTWEFACTVHGRTLGAKTLTNLTKKTLSQIVLSCISACQLYVFKFSCEPVFRHFQCLWESLWKKAVTDKWKYWMDRWSWLTVTKNGRGEIVRKEIYRMKIHCLKKMSHFVTVRIFDKY